MCSFTFPSEWTLKIQAQRVRFATVDLAAETKTIREQLLRIVNEEPRSRAN